MITELDPSSCERLLADNHYGHLGFHDGMEPHVLPVTYVFMDGYVYGYTLPGEKVEILRKHPHVCLQVERVETGYEWDSVACWGEFEEVTDPVELKDIRGMLADEHGEILLKEGKAPVSPLIKHLSDRDGAPSGITYRVKIRRMTGRSERP